jgi:hypothetical protein
MEMLDRSHLRGGSGTRHSRLGARLPNQFTLSTLPAGVMMYSGEVIASHRGAPSCSGPRTDAALNGRKTRCAIGSVAHRDGQGINI